MKRSPPGDFHIRGQAKRLQPEPLSPTSAREDENGSIAARIHSSTSGPVSPKDVDHSRGSRSTHFLTQNWSNHSSSLTWRRSSTERAASERVRRGGYDSMCCDCTLQSNVQTLTVELYFSGYRPAELSLTTDTRPREFDCMCFSQSIPVWLLLPLLSSNSKTNKMVGRR